MEASHLHNQLVNKAGIKLQSKFTCQSAEWLNNAISQISIITSDLPEQMVLPATLQLSK